MMNGLSTYSTVEQHCVKLPIFFNRYKQHHSTNRYGIGVYRICNL